MQEQPAVSWILASVMIVIGIAYFVLLCCGGSAAIAVATETKE
jgi:hypothetical protein